MPSLYQWLWMLAWWTCSLQTASACCMCHTFPTDTEEALFYADIVVLGKVLDQKRYPLERQGTRGEVYYFYEVRVQVRTIYKGKLDSAILHVHTSVDSEMDCGYSFEPDKYYFIYTRQSWSTPRIHYTGICTYTQRYTHREAKVLDALRCSCYDALRPELPDHVLCTEAEGQPQFEGGQAAWLAYLYDHLPPLSNPVEEVPRAYLLSFVIDEKGRLVRPRILRPDGSLPTTYNSHEAQVLEVLDRSPRWTPGHCYGRKVPIWIQMPLPLCRRKE